jgi:hypothetical protein
MTAKVPFSDEDYSIAWMREFEKDLIGKSGNKWGRVPKKTGSGYKVQDKDKDRDCDRYNNHCHRVDVNRTLIFALVIIDQPGG